jgi:(p)ppGpp synthase/HD superfamily hydrolase
MKSLNRPLSTAELKLLMLPLSGTTHLLGEAGLLQRFELETASFGVEGQTLTNQAVGIASHLFANDRYKGMPYMTHLLRVAIRLTRDYGVEDPEIIAAALLHDTIEDHGDELVQMVGELDLTPVCALTTLVGKRVADLVQALSNEPTSKELSDVEKRLRYRLGVEKKLALGFDVFLIKLSDFTDNAIGLHWGEDDSKTRKVAMKYLPLFPVFVSFVERYETNGSLATLHAEFARMQLATGATRCQEFVEASPK